MDALGRPRVIGASMLLSAVKPAALRAGRMKRWPGIAAPVRAKHPRSSRDLDHCTQHGGFTLGRDGALVKSRTDTSADLSR